MPMKVCLVLFGAQADEEGGWGGRDILMATKF